MQPTPPGGGDIGDPYGGAYAPCYRHPDRVTGVRCIRCNRPICPQCQNAASVGFQCPDDVQAGAANTRQPRTVAGAVVSNGKPVVSYLLIALNVLAYLATALGSGGSLTDNKDQLFYDWVMTPYSVGHDHEYARLLTAAFVHIGPLHLLVNMFALYLIGPALERVLGWWRFAAVYLLSAFGGSVAILLFADVQGAVAGASGAIYGLFACALVASRVAGFDARSLIFTIAINFLITFSVPGISKMGHLGGFVVGSVATVALIGLPRRRTRPVRPNARTQAVGLMALLVLLMVLAGVRVASLADYQPTALASVIQPATVRVGSVLTPGCPHGWKNLGRTTPL